MNSIKLSKKDKSVKGKIILTASKSESNRLLVIRAFCNDKFKIMNLAEAWDTQTMQHLLNSPDKILDVGPAGTAMRFLIAYYSIKPGKRIITGSERMKERPVSILINALRELGADITYLENEGFPPLEINGKVLNGGEISIEGDISSQYISALLLIAPRLKSGLEIHIQGDLTSRPYVSMTIAIMKYFSAEVSWENNNIKVKSGEYKPKDFIVEADWSAASYWYEIAALAKEAEIILHGLKKESLQGDAVVADIFKNFGVETTFINDGIKLTKKPFPSLEGLGVGNVFNYDFSDCPDIAQTVAVTMAALKINGKLTGLHSLKIKETDRILALKNELEKLGCIVQEDENSITLQPSFNSKLQTLNIKTYEDHRMAMAFAPLALMFSEVIIENPEVVNKSYPGYWGDLKKVGFKS